MQEENAHGEIQWNFHSNPFFGGENDLSVSLDLDHTPETAYTSASETAHKTKFIQDDTGGQEVKARRDDETRFLEVTRENSGLAEEVVKLEGMLAASIEREKTMANTLKQMKEFAEQSHDDAKSSLEKAEAAQK